VLLASLTHFSSMTSVESAELEGSSIFAEVGQDWRLRLAKDRRRALDHFSPPGRHDVRVHFFSAEQFEIE
jgi:hypothetical protein